MADLLTGEILMTRSVAPEVAARVLAEAVAGGARVDLRADSDGVEMTCNATIVGGDDSFLALDVGPAASAISASSQLNASMEIGDARYMFEVRCADEAAEIGPGVVRVEKPVTITTIDRRRSPRRKLHQPTTVTLRRPTDRDEPYCQARMLNLSVEGIACLMPAAKAEGLAANQTLRVAFCLGPPSCAFDLNGRVVNTTRGGTADHFVVGIEFVADERLTECRAKLEEGLEATG